MVDRFRLYSSRFWEILLLQECLNFQCVLVFIWWLWLTLSLTFSHLMHVQLQSSLHALETGYHGSRRFYSPVTGQPREFSLLLNALTAVGLSLSLQLSNLLLALSGLTVRCRHFGACRSLLLKLVQIINRVDLLRLQLQIFYMVYFSSFTLFLSPDELRLLGSSSIGFLHNI